MRWGATTHGGIYLLRWARSLGYRALIVTEKLQVCGYTRLLPGFFPVRAPCLLRWRRQGVKYNAGKPAFDLCRAENSGPLKQDFPTLPVK